MVGVRSLQLLIFTLLASPNLLAAYANFNSVLIGEQASGMGGAYTAMSGDSSSSGFYNPASLVKLTGADISASVTVFKKFDTAYGANDNLVDAGERVNRGFFRTIPSAVGNVYRWKKWAFGFSLIVPDYDFFSGNIANTPTTQSFLNYTDESLWNGIVGSYKASPNESFGLSIYYTARSLIRSSLDRQVISPSHEIITTEEKSINHNAIVVILGYLWEINEKWSFGASVRPPGMNIHGEGSYYLAVTDTNNLPSQIDKTINTSASTYIPPRYALGFVYKPTSRLTLSMDGVYFSGHSYRDMDLIEASDLITHQDTFNFAIGMQYYFEQPKMAWRFGLFTNHSSHPTPYDNPTERVPESLDMYGFSSNLSFYSTEHSRYTLGGYYSGGNGYSVQRTGNGFARLEKSHHIFTLLISTSYQF